MRFPTRPALFHSLLLALATASSAAVAQPMAVDLLIRGGRVIDGTGTEARAADVGVRGDRIVFVGDARARGVTAARTLDATGLVVAPGFIDPHTHTSGDLSDPTGRANAAYLMQGVTTVITGNDGGGPVDVARTLAEWDRDSIGTNAALFVGHGSVRRAVLGSSSAAPTPSQLDSMRALVAGAMRGGALGLSSGLYYTPGSFAKTEEVIELARVAARAGGVYDTHMRDESSYTIGLLGSIEESIRIGREAGIPVNISHIKALGTDVWGKSAEVIAAVEAARRAGVKVTADQYPYTASGTGLGASLLPRWAEAGGGDSLRARVADPATRARLVTDMTDNMRRRGGPESLLLVSGREGLRGKTLAAIARERELPPIEAGLQLILEGWLQRRLVQHERAGHRAVHATRLGDDGLRRLGRSPAKVRHVSTQAPRVRLHPENRDAPVRDPRLDQPSRRDVRLPRARSHS